MFFCACSTNSTDCAFDAESTVQVVGRARQSRMASIPVPKLKPMRADFTAPLNREPSITQRCWYGLSWMTGGSFGSNAVDALTDAADVVGRDGAAVADFADGFISRFFKRLALALAFLLELRDGEFQLAVLHFHLLDGHLQPPFLDLELPPFALLAERRGGRDILERRERQLLHDDGVAQLLGIPFLERLADGQHV